VAEPVPIPPSGARASPGPATSQSSADGLDVAFS
jgi:hypothetical protein